jgi:hypothetical protein
MSDVPVVTARDVELEQAELLPARETLMVGPLYPRFYKPGGPMRAYPGPVHAIWG